MRKRIVSEVTCPSCGARAGEPCKVTLSEHPEVPLSIVWRHPSRDRAAAA